MHPTRIELTAQRDESGDWLVSAEVTQVPPERSYASRQRFTSLELQEEGGLPRRLARFLEDADAWAREHAP